MFILYHFLKELLLGIGFSDKLAVWSSTLLTLLAIMLLSIVANLIVKSVIKKIFRPIAERTRTEWDRILFKNNTFNGLAHFVPAMIIYSAAGFAASDVPQLPSILKKVAYVYATLIIVSTAVRLLSSIHEIYKTYSFSKDRPVKGYVQSLKIIVYFVGGVFIISVLIDQSPKSLFTGLGAIAAVLMLVFKDPILGFVASVQLVANKMVRTGDWISMPKYNADGTIEDISLTTVKVQNWDKTVTTIPTHALVSESVTNWKGMEESGGRRIKRSISIDMRSVKFCDREMLDRLSEFRLIRDCIINTERDIEEFNKKHGLSENDVLLGRKQTNLGIFRKYLEEYLHAHPKIHDNMTFLVRHLQPSEKGIPVEIYVFSNDQEWANYESIQADIFDHLLAVLPQFELKVFQSPTGDDFKNFAVIEKQL